MLKHIDILDKEKFLLKWFPTLIDILRKTDKIQVRDEKDKLLTSVCIGVSCI